VNSLDVERRLAVLEGRAGVPREAQSLDLAPLHKEVAALQAQVKDLQELTQRTGDQLAQLEKDHADHKEHTGFLHRGRSKSKSASG
jgi:hypothetical protein